MDQAPSTRAMDAAAPHAVTAGAATAAAASAPAATLPPAAARARLPIALRVMAVVSFLVPGLFLAGAALLDHQRLNTDAYATVERLSAVAKEHALKVIETNAMVLDRIADLVGSAEWAELDARGEALQAELRRIGGSIQQIAALQVVRRNGHLGLTSQGWPTPPLDLSATPFFRRLAGGATGLVLGEPQRDALTDSLVFAMARPIFDRQGHFNGAIVGQILPSYLEASWQTMDPDARVAFTLLRRDGMLLAQHPGGVAEGAEPPAEDELPPVLRAATDTEPGTTRYGDEWLSAFRRVGDHPLFVGVTLDLATVEAAWWRNTQLTASICCAAALLLGLTTLMALRRWRSEQEVLARLQRTADELRAEIERREAVETELRQAQRLDALGRLTGGIAHDFNNLLTAILGTVSLLERHLASNLDDRARRLFGAARDAVNRGARLNKSLLAFARRQPLKPTTLDANGLIGGFAHLMQRALGDTSPLRLVLDERVPACRADATQLEAALLNLAINARDAMPRGGEVVISTRLAWLTAEELRSNTDAQPGGFVAITLRDTGSGMPPEVRDRAFEPFFTTKPVGKGTGLGLSQVYGFVRQLGGHVAIETEVGIGTAITLFLQADAAEVTPPAPPAEETGLGERVVSMSRATILFAEDDERVREIAAEMLREAGFRVLAAAHGPAALELLRGPERIDLMFSDVMMPGGLDGYELALEARRLRPRLPVLLTTGLTTATATDGSTPEDHGFEVVAKPYDHAALIRRLREMLATAQGHVA